MRGCWLLSILALGILSWGQAQPTSVPPPSKSRPAAVVHDEDTDREDDKDHDQAESSASEAQVAPGAVILTIKGYCDKTARKPGVTSRSVPCQTVITRAEFEKLTASIQPNMSPEIKHQLANSYPKLLVMAQMAEKRGLDKGSKFAERMRFARLQILSQELVRDIGERAAEVPPAAIEDYYRKNAFEFQQAELERVLIPLRKQGVAVTGSGTDEASRAQQKDAQSAMTQLAEQLRARAVAGEEFAKLQQDAYQASGIRGNPPTSLSKVRPKDLPRAHVSVFDLKPGEVSPVITDVNGHYIYKLDSKGLAALAAVKDEISNTLRNQRMKEMIESIDESYQTILNQKYFKPRPPSDVAAAPSM